MTYIRIHPTGTPRRWSGGRSEIDKRSVRATATVGAGLVALLLVGCSTDGRSSDQTPGAASTAPSSTAPPPAASTTQPISTTTRPPESSTTRPPEISPPLTNAEPTLPPGPPVFDPQALGDNLTLPSFVLTVTIANTNSGQLSESNTTSGFINDPVSRYDVATFSSGGTTDSVRTYLIGGRSYEENQFGDWYLYESGSPAAPDSSHGLDLRSGTLAGVVTARLDGQADFAGIQANHFVFDETDLASYSSYTPEHPSPAVEGDFYLAREGSYVLYTHSTETSPERTYEVTEALSSVGQVAEIVLPAELAPMTRALDLGVDLGRLLPPGASLSSMIRYAHGIGVDYYTYGTSVRAIDDFLDFYRTLPPTDGWTVAHIGHVTPHLEQIDCETAVDCIILDNGGEQIVVSFAGRITVEYDHEHVFRPL